ncbi:MAG TPA: cytochrome c oxidase assembly protein [Mycobacteriales bacterium]|nr:cytochrome c oxidase assembly protein [Mycobacteriales bacterium]
MNLPPLDLGQLAGHWQARPGVLAAVLLVALAYLAGTRRAAGWPVGRTLAFLGGLAVVVVATCSGIEAYGHVLEWMHMIEHLALIMVAPVLLAIGSPLQLAADALPARGAAAWRAFLDRPVVGWLTSPVAAALLYAVCVIGVHLTGIMDSAMDDQGVHVTEELAYLLSGMLLFQLVFGRRPGPWQLSGGGRLALLALVTPVDTVVGVVLLQTGTVDGGLVGGPHAHPRPSWALSAASDTVAAGTTMWIGGTGIMALLMLVVGLIWLHGRAPAPAAPGWTERARAAALAEKTGEPERDDLDSDDDALASYNRWLARMAERDR